MGFAIPIASWLSNELKGLVDSYISEEKITNQGIFHWEAIAELKHIKFGMCLCSKCGMRSGWKQHNIILKNDLSHHYYSLIINKFRN